ncbi:trimeric intracellular cation channel family protein [Chitinibacteraceae bacterium HSL-7]
MPGIQFDWFSHIGTAAFAFSGYLIGVRKQFDMLGVVILVLLTAIGGGMMRDVLVGETPRVFSDATPLYTIFAVMAVAWLLKLQQRAQGALHRLFVIADSIGLVAFSITGALVGLGHDLNLFGVCFLGFITAVGGGLVRDMLVNDVPFILHEDFYGTIAILVAAAVFVLFGLNSLERSMLWLVFSAGLALRLFAHLSDLRLPRFD